MATVINISRDVLTLQGGAPLIPGAEAVVDTTQPPESDYLAAGLIAILSSTPGAPIAASVLFHSIAFMGAYDSTKVYFPGQVVTSGGLSYISIQQGNGQTPASQPTYWFSLSGDPTLSYPLGTDVWQNMAIGTGYPQIQPGVQPTLAQYNVALGWEALKDVSTGNYNTGVGAAALASNSDGVANTAVGTQALQGNTHGGNNTAVGQTAMGNNSTGDENTAVGWTALITNTSGNNNTAVGVNSLAANTTASNSVAVGMNALTNHTTGGANTAVGGSAGSIVTTGEYNTHVGYQAGSTGTGTNWYTTCIGKGTSATGQGGVAIGVDSTGVSATAPGDTIVLGTAKHVVQLAGAPTASAPAYKKGAMYFDTTLNKLRIGGATTWETVTSS